MAKAESETEVQAVVLEWILIASKVAKGILSPEDGAAMLQALAKAHPGDEDWLQEEVKIIRHQFGLDVAEPIESGEGSYWEKLRSVIDALLEERIDHDRALALLRTIDVQHPEHSEQTMTLITGLEHSPLRRLLDSDD